MDEPKFATLARQYIQFLDRQNEMKPANWSQENHTQEMAWKNSLLSQMRDALGD